VSYAIEWSAPALRELRKLDKPLRDQQEITSRMCRLSMTSPLGSFPFGVPAG
jgi:mRNA-degrading endonuclease RelE of RelBE toxin-antitoxin system